MYVSLHFLGAFQPSRKDSAFVSRIVLQGAKLEVIVQHALSNDSKDFNMPKSVACKSVR